MRPSPSPACAILTSCLLACFGLGCNAGGPYGADQGFTATPVTSPVTQPVTPVTGNQSSNSSVSVMVSDPSACQAPNGPLTHFYISIADIEASTNPDAVAGDSSFVDLTPGLSSAPQQVDLLGQPNSRCFLASLSAGTQVAAGNYQQVRIFLAQDSAAATVPNNACGAFYSNCVVLSDNSLHDLTLTSATAQGIEIPQSRIANAGLALNTGETPTIDLNFDACSSLLTTATSAYEFNPTVHAGLVPSTGGSISGTIVSSTTGQPLNGGQVVVALEQKDAQSGVDRILMRTNAGSNGSFVLCPVPQGTYDLVAVGVDGSNVAYSAGVEEGIQSGQLAGKIPLVPGSTQGTLLGMMTTQDASAPPVGVSVAVQANALQQLAGDGLTISVPLLTSQSPFNEAMLTAAGSSCPTGEDCSPFTMQLPAITPNVVTCSQQTVQFHQEQGTPTYMAESLAEIAGSGGIADCASSDLTQASTLQGGPIVLLPGQSATARNMTYTQCR